MGIISGIIEVLGLNSRKEKNKEPYTEFDHLLDFAKEVANKNPNALINIVRLLLRPLQTELLLSAVKNKLHGACHEIETDRFFMPSGPFELQHAWNYPKLNPESFLIHLNRDPVLPCPWHRDRYVGNLTSIGQDSLARPWKEDSVNHNAVVWLPWGIAFVDGGNHSIATGILNGEGTLKPKEVYDMSAMLDAVYCDGKQFRASSDHRMLNHVYDPVIAALFEVGRLMHKHSVIPMHNPSIAQ